MPTIINAVVSSGLSISNDSSGILQIQSNGINTNSQAWAKFNGGSGNTAGTILSSYNVSSITVNGTGDYTINFTNALPDANYCLVGTSKKSTGQSSQSIPEVILGYYNQSYTTTTARINNIAAGSGPDLCESVSIVVFR
jgi:hypothetical protein